MANTITTAIEKLDKNPQVILTSFHGIPKRYTDKGDPYYHHCIETSDLVRKKLKWTKDKWEATFQSRFGPEEWLQPYTSETLSSLAQKGVKRIAVLSPAFVSECIETLEEIEIKEKEDFLNAGGEEFTYIPCLNESPAHIDLLSDLIKREMSGWIN
ncbi:MAG: ferrochelatase [Alphaproteobacteria bacterium]|nr:MAG: ferrochelatase [Alphaproteobacteria bacterium]